MSDEEESSIVKIGTKPSPFVVAGFTPNKNRPKLEPQSKGRPKGALFGKAS